LQFNITKWQEDPTSEPQKRSNINTEGILFPDHMRFAVIELKGHSLSNNEEHNQAGALKECSMRNRLARVGKKDSNMPYNGSYHKGHKGQATHCKSRITWKLADDDILSWDRSPSSGLFVFCDDTKHERQNPEEGNNERNPYWRRQSHCS